MQFEVRHAPTFPTLDVTLDEGEVAVAQPGAMLCMDPGFEVTAAVGGAVAKRGAFGGLGSMLAGESFFRANYRARRDGQTIAFAPEHSGDIVHVALDGQTGWLVSRGAYLAHLRDVDLSVRFEGVRGLVTRTGMFLLHASGEGDLFCASHGSAVSRELGEGERFVLDNRFVVAFTDGMRWEAVKVAESIGASLFSGEGMVNRFTGPGTVWYQTRAGTGSGRGMLGLLLESVF